MFHPKVANCMSLINNIYHLHSLAKKKPSIEIPSCPTFFRQFQRLLAPLLQIIQAHGGDLRVSQWTTWGSPDALPWRAKDVLQTDTEQADCG